MTTAMLSSKNQITLPKEVRDRLQVASGDRVTFEPTPDGRFVVGHASPVQRSDGAAKKRLRKSPPRLGSTDSAVTRAVMADDKRITGEP